MFADPDVAEKIINPSYLRDVAELSEDSPTSPCPELRQQIQFLNIQAQVFKHVVYNWCIKLYSWDPKLWKILIIGALRF